MSKKVRASLVYSPGDEPVVERHIERQKRVTRRLLKKLHKKR
jgi:hypothetical protein